MRYKVLITVTSISFILTLSLFLLVNYVPNSFSLKSFNLNHMLNEIHIKTKQLGVINQNILQGLLSIDDKSSETKEVSNQLRTINQGARQQGRTLSQIRDVTKEQVHLGNQLNSISNSLTEYMKSISTSSQSQSQNGLRLTSVSKNTLTQLQEALKQNKELEKRLKAAASKSQRAANSLP